MTTSEGEGRPIRGERDESSSRVRLDRVNVWIAHTLGAQVEFRVLAADVAAKLMDTPWEEPLARVAEDAARHEKEAEAMFLAIGREPWRLGKLTGPVLAKSREVLAFLIHTTTGASFPWTGLQQLLTVSLGAINAFSVAEQLGHAIGNPALAAIASRIAREKAPHHHLIEEVVLKSAPMAILHGSETGEDTATGQGGRS